MLGPDSVSFEPYNAIRCWMTKKKCCVGDFILNTKQDNQKLLNCHVRHKNIWDLCVTDIFIEFIFIGENATIVRRIISVVNSL